MTVDNQYVSAVKKAQKAIKEYNLKRIASEAQGELLDVEKLENNKTQLADENDYNLFTQQNHTVIGMLETFMHELIEGLNNEEQPWYEGAVKYAGSELPKNDKLYHDIMKLYYEFLSSKADMSEYQQKVKIMISMNR